jgi:Uma2 family endonuclease
MPVTIQGGPLLSPIAGIHRLSVKQYHKMIESGVLTEDDRVELLEGILVDKMPHDPMHDGTIQKSNRRLLRTVPAGWEIRVQSSVTLVRSEPEPDLAIVRDDVHGYMRRHPGAADFGVVIEVSNSSLETDRTDKLRIYARAGLPVYWIINVVNGQVEAFEQPSGADYASNKVYRRGDSVALALDGVVVGNIPAADLLP